MVKDSDKEKYVCSGYGIVFDRKSERSFNTYYARNVIIFGVENSWSSHADKLKNNFLMLGEGDTFDINESLGASGKSFSINFSKANSKLFLSLQYNADNSYLFVIEKEVFKFNQ